MGRASRTRTASWSVHPGDAGPLSDGFLPLVFVRAWVSRYLVLGIPLNLSNASISHTKDDHRLKAVVKSSTLCPAGPRH